MGETEDIAPGSTTGDAAVISAEPVELALLAAEPEAEAEPAPAPVAAPDAEPVAEPAAEPEPASFDDIPSTGPTTEAVEATVADTAHLKPSVPWWPFLAYLGAWVVLASAAVWQLLQLPANQVAYESTAYSLTILGGLIMMAVGPLLILAVWFSVRATRSAVDRSGLLSSSLIQGALVTLGGAVIWWAALVIVDYMRLGRPL